LKLLWKIKSSPVIRYLKHKLQANALNSYCTFIIKDCAGQNECKTQITMTYSHSKPPKHCSLTPYSDMANQLATLTQLLMRKLVFKTPLITQVHFNLNSDTAELPKDFNSKLTQVAHHPRRM